MDICNNQNVIGYMVTMDIEKACDTLDYDFLLKVIENIGFFLKILVEDLRRS